MLRESSSTPASVGVRAVGYYLPPEIRRNDWWSPDTVARWRADLRDSFSRFELGPEDQRTEGVLRTVAAMEEIGDDPFQGMRERRALSPEMGSIDMEVAAATDALERSGVARDDIDFVLSFALVPDYQGANGACLIHKRLGLRERCFAVAVDGVCNSFLLQLALAKSLVRSGAARYGLLVQSSAPSRLAPREAHFSPWFGDGATAVVVGPVDAGRGLLAHTDHTDGTRHRAVLSGVPGKRWYDEGRVITYSEDPQGARQMLLTIADRGRAVVAEVLEAASLRPADVAFYACHQPTGWFRKVTQRYLGLDDARSIDIFPTTGSLSACNVPLQLALAERAGDLVAGDLVAIYTGGTGETWSAAALRWGD